MLARISAGVCRYRSLVTLSRRSTRSRNVSLSASPSPAATRKVLRMGFMRDFTSSSASRTPSTHSEEGYASANERKAREIARDFRT